MSPRREASIHPSTSDEDECTFIDSSWFDRDGMYPSIPKEFNSCSVEQNFKTSTLVGVEDTQSAWSRADRLGGNPNPNPNHFRVRSDNAFSCVQEKGGDSRVSRASKKTLFVTDEVVQSSVTKGGHVRLRLKHRTGVRPILPRGEVVRNKLEKHVPGI